MSDNNLVTKSDLGEFYGKILPYLGSGLKLAGPVGMIISYMGNTAPSGYLACDGSWYNIGDYPKLANWMMDEFESYSYFALSGETVPTGKFKVPDLRGEFLRGTGTNSHANQGSGASVGVHQDGTEQLRIGANNSASGSTIFVQNVPNFNNGYTPRNADSAYKVQGSGTGRNYDTTSQWTDSGNNVMTSRPTNTSVLYCIKYEEYEGDGAGEVYSTDERVVGKWIDSKPLYQKTIYISSFVDTAGTNKSTAHGITNFGFLVNMFGTVKMNNGTFAPLPFASSFGSGDIMASCSASVFVTDTGINTDTKYSRLVGQPAYITLQYTKTT